MTASRNQVDTVKYLTLTDYDPDLKLSIIVIGFKEDMEGGLRFTQLCGNDVIATPDSIGLFRDGLWGFDVNGNGQWDGEPTDRAIWFGMTGDKPVTGRW